VQYNVRHHCATPGAGTDWVVQGFNATLSGEIRIRNAAGATWFIENPWPGVTEADVKGRTLRILQTRCSHDSTKLEAEWVDWAVSNEERTGTFKPVVKLYGARLVVGKTHTIKGAYGTPVDGVQRVLLDDDHYIENPFSTVDEALGKKFIIDDIDTAKGYSTGTITIRQLVSVDTETSGFSISATLDAKVRLFGAVLQVGKMYTIKSEYVQDSHDCPTVMLNDGHYIENPFDNAAQAIGKTFTITSVNKSKDTAEITINLGGTPTSPTSGSASAVTAVTKHTCEYLDTCTGESSMNGAVYSGTVVITRTVAVGEGVTTGVQISEVAFDYKERFIAQSDEAAKAVILSTALIANPKLSVNDPRTPIEVRLQKF
jgi:hypothetical protein